MVTGLLLQRMRVRSRHWCRIAAALALLALATIAAALTPPRVIPGKFGIIDGAGHWVLPGIYDLIDDASVADRARIAKGGRWGYVDPQGRIAVPLRYMEATTFDPRGFAIARTEDSGKYGVIDVEGRWRVQPVYDSIRRPDGHGLMLAVQGTEAALIDDQGAVRLRTPLRPAWFAANGLGMVQVGDKWGFIDLQGTMVIPPRYRFARGFAANGLALVVDAQGQAFIDRTGTVVHRRRAGLVQLEDAPPGSLARVQDSATARWGFVDDRGRVVIEPRYQTATGFVGEVALVMQDDRYGMIDRTGTLVIPNRYEQLGFFDDQGMAPARWNGRWGFIDRSLEFVIAPRFESAHGFAANGLARVMLDGRVGFVDRKGRMAIKPEYYDTPGYAGFGFNAAGRAIVQATPSSHGFRLPSQDRPVAAQP